MLNYTIHASDSAAEQAAKSRWNAVAKPLHSLGRLEDLIVRIAGIQKTPQVCLRPRCGLIFCGDHGVVAKGVSQTEQRVSLLVTEAIAAGTSNVNLMAALSGTPVYAVDVGLAGDPGHPAVIRRKIARGTKDLSVGPAMTRQEAEAAIQAGIDLVAEKKEQGIRLIALGEMGIGNTTATAALSCVFLGMSVRSAVDRGAGLSDEGLIRKRRAVRRALRVNEPDAKDPIGALSKVGGLEICAMTGAFLGGMTWGVPVILDGVICGIAALAACRICPQVRAFILPSHRGTGAAARRILEELNLKAVLDADLALGEGTGAAALLPLLDMAEAVYAGVHTFQSLGMDAYRERGGRV